MTKHIDFGKPGDPSGCYMPREWWVPARPAKNSTRSPSEASASALPPDTQNPEPSAPVKP